MIEFFERFEATLNARFHETEIVEHSGDRGENREEMLSTFLRQHLPARYGVIKGQVVTSTGETSYAVDIIIYDAIDCPVLYQGRTAVVPIEGVYGIIEVKSTLSKTELLDCMRKIAAFKRLAPRDLSVIRTREYVTVHRPSRPFGIVIGYRLANNSLSSLLENVEQEHRGIHDVNYFTNLVCVLGNGLIHYEKADLDAGEKTPLLDTDEFVNLVLTAQKRERANEPELEVVTRLMSDEAGDRTLGRLYVLLLTMLARSKLSVPDLGRYLDPDLPIQVYRES